MANKGPSILDPVEAPNACPDCKHTPRTVSQCFGFDIQCLDWRGRRVMCLCANAVHFNGGS